MMLFRGSQGGLSLRPGRPWLVALLLCLGLVSGFRAAAAGCLPIPTGVVSWWPADGNANDIAGTNNGALTGTATASAAGFIGSAFSFDGTNSSVQIPDAASLRPTNLTIEAWVLFTGLDSAGANAPAGEQFIVFKQNTRSSDFEGFYLGKTRIAAQDKFTFQVTSSLGQPAEIDSATVISTGVWYHVAGVRGSNFTQIYVNGQLERQTNITFAQNYGTLPLFFGTSGNSSWDRKLKGLLDEVSLFNRALSSNEIAAIYSAGSGGKCKGVTITAQPQNQSVVAGANAAFSVGASGFGTLSYQWRFKGTNLAGATATSLSLTNVQAANAGNYDVVVTNFLSSATSAVATLTVAVPPSISAQPQSRTNVAGTDAGFTIAGTGNPLPNYQWRFNGGNISGATGTSYTRTNAQCADAGSYDVVLTNQAGSLTSSVAVLTTVTPPAINTGPAGQTIAQGQNANFSVLASNQCGGGLTYQWRFNGGNIAGATGTSYTRTNAQCADAGNFDVVVTTLGGSVTSSVAALNVAAPPSISSGPVSQSVTQGQNVSFNVLATNQCGAGLTYQWRFNGGSLAGATGTGYTLTNAQCANAGNYDVVVTNLAGGLTSSVAVLSIVSPLTISSGPVSQSVTQGQFVSFSVVATNQCGGGLTYQWRFNGGTIAAASGTNFNLVSAQCADAGNYDVVVTNLAGSVTSSVAVLSVVTPPLISVPPMSQTVAQSQNVNFSVAATNQCGAGLTYQWRFNGAGIAGATGTSYTRTNAQCADAGNYDVVVTNLAGGLTSSVAVLSVVAPPSISTGPASQTIPQGQNVSFSIQATNQCGGGLTYQWRFNGGSIGGATGTTYTRTNAQCANAGNYDVVVSNLGGSATSSVAVVSVVAPPSITTPPASQTVAQGANISFNVGATNACGGGLSYQWRFNGATIGGETGTSYIRTNAQCSDAGNFDVVVTTLAGAVTSGVAVVSVVAPPGISSAPGDQTLAQGQNATFSVLATNQCGGGLSYQWRFNGANLSGENGTNYTRVAAQCADAGAYDVVATTLGGSVTSSIAALSVVAPPLINTGPSSQIVAQGQDASFNVVAANQCGGGLSYQWRFNGDGISGATATAYTRTTAQCVDAGNYDVVVTTLGGSVTSGVAVVSVVAPPAIAIPPAGQTVAQGQNINMSVLATNQCGGGLSYQWRFNAGNIFGATGSSYTRAGAQCADAGNYDVVVTTLAGAVTSSVALVNVVAPPGISLPPAGQTIAQGQSVSFNALATNQCGGGLTYQWQYNGATIPGATGTSLSLSPVQFTNAGSYSAVASDLAGSVTSAVATLVVVCPAVTVAPGSLLGGIAGIAYSQSLSANGGLAPYTFSVIGGSLPPGLTLSAGGIVSGTPTSQGGFTFTVRAADFDSCGGTNIYVIGIGCPAITVGPVLISDGFIGTPYNLNLTASGGTAPYTFSVTAGTLPAGLNLSGSGALTGSLTTAGTYNFTVTAIDTNTCPGGQSYIVVVSGTAPGIAQQPQGRTSIAGSDVTLSVSGTGTPSPSYQWRKNGLNLLTATAAAFVLPNVSTNDSGNYDVILTNVAGVITSSVATLVVVDIPDPQLKAALFCALGTNCPCATSGDLAALTNLWACNNSITNLTGLGAALNLNSLSLAGNGISDLTPLQPLSRLTRLDVQRNNVTNLSMLGALTKLNSLALGRNPVANYSALAGLTNLTSLSVCSGAITNLGFVQNLRQLTEAALYNNLFTDISPLATLPNLNRLDLRWNTISNLAVVSGMTNLTRLYLGSTAVSNLSFLQGLTGMTFLNLEANQIQDLSPLVALTNLDYLALSWNPITNHAVLAGLTRLANLELRGNSLTNVSFLSALGRLSYADLAQNSLTDLTPMAGAANLSLVLDGNTNLNYAALSGLTNLARVWLDGNMLSDAGFLQNMPQLRAVGLEQNNISNLSPLAGLTNLELLGLSANPVTNLNPLAGLAGLASLRLDGNSLSNNVGFVTNLTQLAFLSLSGNRVAGLPPLSALTNLGSLYVTQNRLCDVSTLTNLPKVRFLDVSLNLLDASADRLSGNVLRCPWGNVGEANLQYLPPDQLSFSAISLALSPLWYIPANRSRTLSFYISDLVVPPNEWSVSAGSSNGALISNGHLTLAGTNESRTLTATTTPGQTGTTTVSLNVQNALCGLSATTNLVARVVSEDPLFSMPDAALSNSVWLATGQPADALTSVDLLNLPSLTLANLQFTNLTGLQWAWNLTNLALTANAFTALTPLSGLTNLTGLSLLNSSISNLAGLQSVTNLTSLSLANNSVRDISLLAGLTNLASLNLDGNALTTVASLHNLTRLTSLSLYSNNITDISPLAGLTNLTSLDLGLNPITNFSVLSGLPNLVSLRVASDLITNISFVATLPHLTLLDLFDNQITVLQPLAALSKLSLLFLDVNQVTNVNVLSNLTALSFVDISLNLLNVNTNSEAFSVVQTLENRGVQVVYLPNRTLTFTLPAPTWLILPNKTSATSVTAKDNGPTNEPVVITYNSSNTNLLPNANVTIAANTNTLFYFGDFTVTVTPRTGQTGTTALNLTATDSAGIVATQVLQIVVGPPLPFDGHSLIGSSNYSWLTWGNAPWFIETTNTHNGISAAQSGDIGDSLESWLQTTVVGPGNLSFWWKVSSETNFDFLEFFTNGVMALTPISGEVDWTQRVVTLGPGSQNIAWAFIKDPDKSLGSDAGWLSEVTFTPLGAWLEMAPGVTNGQVKLTLHGILGHLYEVQVSTNLSTWSTLTIVTATNNAVIIFDTAAGRSPRFYRLHDLSFGALRLDAPSVSHGAVLLVLHSPAGLRFRLQSSSNLTSWATLATVTNSAGVLPYSTAVPTNSPRQFYRAQLLMYNPPPRQAAGLRYDLADRSRGLGSKVNTQRRSLVAG